MAATSRRSSSRALRVYLSAVVGPTLLVLAAGLFAVRRQADALEAQRALTRSLQEARIAETGEREAVAQASAAMRSPLLEPLERLSDQTPEALNGASVAVASFKQAHLLVRDVLVLEDGELLYPLVETRLPARLEDWLAAEPAAMRPRIARQLSRAGTHERAGRYREAADTFAAARATATTGRLAAHALAAEARCASLSGDGRRATAVHGRLIHDHASQYSLSGRPHAVLAAIELRRAGMLTAAISARVADDVKRGRWPMSVALLEHVRAELRLPAETIATQVEAARRAVVVRDDLRASRLDVPGQVRVRTVRDGEGALDVVSEVWVGRDTRVVALVLDPGWLRHQLLPAVGTRLAPGNTLQVGSEVPDGHPGFRSLQPDWRVALHPSATPSGWRTIELAALSSTALAVLGVLVMGVVLLMRDVTRETALNRLRADLVSGVSHELKAPISVIRVCAETLETATDATPTDRRHFARAIVEETYRLERLVDGVVDFSRIQQGERAYRLVPTSLPDTVADALARFSAYAELHGFRLVSHPAPPISPLPLDAVAVQRAILNVLDNAAKYAGDAGTADIAIRVADGQAIVEVRDDGPGIAAEEQARIFERFHRGSDHHDRGGYGLGLYLVRHVMEAHGGRVDVESRPGHGSTFRLIFPLHGARDGEDSARRG